jgi:hypothetical protein
MPPINTATGPRRRRRLVVANPDDPLGLVGDDPPHPLASQASDLETATTPTRCETVSR